MIISNKLKRSVLLAACCCAALLLFGCADDKSKLTEAEKERIALAKEVELVQAAGGLVLMVEGEALSSDELLEAPIGGYGPGANDPVLKALEPLARNTTLDQFKVQAHPVVEGVLVGKISGILLYQHAVREADGNTQLSTVIDGLVEKEWREYVLSFGGDVAKADEELIAKGTDRKKYKEDLKKRYTTQAFIASKFPRDDPITYSQLTECYDRVKGDLYARSAKVVFRLIDISVVEVPMGESGQSPMEQAKRLAEDLMKRIRAGEDFGELAKQYSHGHRNSFGGLWDEVSPESLARPYDQVVKATDSIEVGQVAGPIDMGGHIFIIKLEERQSEGYEPFEKVQREVERLARAERENMVMYEIGMKYMGQASAGKTDEFMDFCLEEIHKRSNQQEAGGPVTGAGS